MEFLLPKRYHFSSGNDGGILIYILAGGIIYDSAITAYNKSVYYRH
jgi:hypothetical protein